MADPTPDVAIIVYPTEDELLRFEMRTDPVAIKPLTRESFPVDEGYVKALREYTDAVMAKVLDGMTIPAGMTAPRLELDTSQEAITESVVDSFGEPAQSTPRDDMAEVWRDIMGEELGGESGHE